jgi:hypothetical protein
MADPKFAERFISVGSKRGQNQSVGRRMILADSVAVKLERHFDIAVSKQSLHRLWIGSDANQERCETVAKVVKSEPARIVLHQSPAVISMR